MKKVIVQIRDVPGDLHLRFKLLCVEKGVSMNRRIIELIQGYVEREEQKKAKK